MDEFADEPNGDADFEVMCPGAKSVGQSRRSPEVFVEPLQCWAGSVHQPGQPLQMLSFSDT